MWRFGLYIGIFDHVQGSLMFKVLSCSRFSPSEGASALKVLFFERCFDVEGALIVKVILYFQGSLFTKVYFEPFSISEVLH